MAVSNPQNQSSSELVGYSNSGLFTGPGVVGTDFHVDMKFRDLLMNSNPPQWEKVVEIVDTMSQQYAARGYRIEFSNEGVSGLVWDPNATLAEKIELAKKVVAAHDHNPATTGFSMDFYIAKNGESRHDKGAEGQEFALALPVGGSVRYAKGGGYDNHAVVFDANGNELYRIGHGDNAKPTPQNFTANQQFLASNNITTTGTVPPSNPQTEAAVASSRQTVPTGEEVQQSVEQNGARNTYQDMMSQMFGGDQNAIGNGGGMIGMLLFALVMFAATGKQIEEGQMNMSHEERLNTLNGVDAQRTPSSPTYTPQDINLGSATPTSPTVVAQTPSSPAASAIDNLVLPPAPQGVSYNPQPTDAAVLPDKSPTTTALTRDRSSSISYPA